MEGPSEPTPSHPHLVMAGAPPSTVNTARNCQCSVSVVTVVRWGVRTGNSVEKGSLKHLLTYWMRLTSLLESYQVCKINT